jgi:hypothetical protein
VQHAARSVARARRRAGPRNGAAGRARCGS